MDTANKTESYDTYSRVAITPEAEKLVEELKSKHGELIFHQSGGCCDGSSPMILPRDEMFLNETDRYIGSIAGIKFYMNQDQFEYWKHTHLTVDITPGRGGSFSLEIPTGFRFLICSRILTKEELDYFKKEDK